MRSDVPRWLRGARRSPILSIVVVAHDMGRELPRTLASLSRTYQRDVDDIDYEVLVIDNGSAEPIPDTVADEFVGDFRLVRIDPAPPSPAHAGNVGVGLSRGRYVAVILDGARLVTPGVVALSVEALRRGPEVVATPIAFHLGPKHQSVSIAEGYGPEAEDAALRGIEWPADGYRLFDVSSLAGANPAGFRGPVNESCFLAVSRRLWDAVGGLDERFDLPGGGLVSLDLFSRLVERPRSELVVLLGEGSFHQVHGGVSTAPGADHERWHRQFLELRGGAYQHPTVAPAYVGEIGPLAERFA